jgi:hypothetical protein
MQYFGRFRREADTEPNLWVRGLVKINKVQRNNLAELYEIRINLVAYFDDSRVDRI